MAVAATHLVTNGSSTDTTSYTTASITPTANRLVLAAVFVSRTGATPSQPTLSGNGLTWVLEESLDTGGAVKIFLFRAMGGSPSAGGVTIDFGTETEIFCGWSISEFSGVDTSGTNGSGAVVQSTTGSATGAASLSVTLGAFASTAHATYGCIGINLNTAITPGSGFTELGEHNNSGTPNRSIESEFKATNDTGVDWSWTGNTTSHGIAVEIRTPVVNATGAGAASGSGSATATRSVVASAAGASAASGTAAATRTVVGTGAGAATGAGTATGSRTVSATAAGAATSSGTAVGTVEGQEPPVEEEARRGAGGRRAAAERLRVERQNQEVILAVVMSDDL